MRLRRPPASRGAGGFTPNRSAAALLLLLLVLPLPPPPMAAAFVVFAPPRSREIASTARFAGGGFGSSASNPARGKAKKKKNAKGRKVKKGGFRGAGGAVAASASPPRPKGTTYVKSDQDALVEQLQAAAATSALGRAVASSPLYGTPDLDEFWSLIPTLVASKFPAATDADLGRVAGFLRHTLDRDLPVEDQVVADEWRPHAELHAYMPGLGPTEPFLDPSRLELCRRLSERIDDIEAEYDALLADMERPGGKDRFQAVTSMNYEAGWRTLVLYYNGHRIEGFPYHLCPVTAEIMESVPIAGRIAGFNRQQPGTGIPLHSDGNNMWLTCQMGIKVPEGQKAYIRVGPETRRWSKGECLVYDTTYEHETFNESETQERVVLHIDFFNTLAMTSLEIDVMQYIYQLREEFMKAEGVAKGGGQVL